MLNVGQLLRDRYRVDALPDATAGLLAFAYRGYDLEEDRACAIKEFEGEDAARFERAAEALASHHHPNLPALYDYFTLDSGLYVILEWPEGENLQARLKRDGKLAENEATQWVSQTLTALDYVRTLNLPLERGGFSPAHIWIDPDGQAKLYGPGLTELAAPPDRAPFTAPEGGDDARADIYAAGATLFALLTARLPEQASPRKFNPAITLPTAQVIQRALAHRPEARYATIREMRKALGRAKPRAERVDLALGTPRVRPQPILIGLIVIILLIMGALFLRGPLTAAIRATPTPNDSGATATVPQPSSTPAPTTAPTRPASTVVAPTSTPSPRPPSATPTLNLTPEAGATAISPIDNMALVFVPAGEFIMGSPDDDPQAFGNEKPEHKVSLPAFWIDRTEVTNAQYQLCVAAGACTPPARTDSVTRASYYGDPAFDDHPVIWVNWVQAGAYCEWASRRLPTEAEWEKAARGADGRAYPWGDQQPDNTLLNFNLAAGDTTKAGSFPNGASPYGALDMSGNIVEWVADYYYDSYFVIVFNTVTPTPSFLGGVRTLRSSSWNDLLANIRAASRRYSASETAAYNNVGFRCASTDRP
jgi:serine/threonine-protein kinase